MTLRRCLEDCKDVEELEALLDCFWLCDYFLQNQAQIVDHVPNQIGHLEHIKQWDQSTADQLEHLRVVDLSIDLLAHKYLIFFTLTELELTFASQFEYVLGEFVWDSCNRVALLYLVFSLQPEVDFFQHFMDAVAVL